MGINWEGALKGLSNGLGELAGYYAKREDKQWQDQREAADRAFRENMQKLQIDANKESQTSNQTFLKSQQEDSQEFQINLFDKQSAIAQTQFATQMKMDEKRLGLGYAQLAQAGNAEEKRSKREALSMFAQNEGAMYRAVADQMGKEIENLSKNPMYSADPNKLEAAKAAIEERYAPKIEEASTRYNTALNSIMEASGSDFRIGDHDALKFGTPAGKAEFKNQASALVDQAVKSGTTLNRNDIAFTIQQQYGLKGKDLLEATDMVMTQYRTKKPAGGSGSW